MKTQIFIGKEKELSTLREVLSDLKIGKPITSINFHGIAGIGKTSLLKKLEQKAPASLPVIYINTKQISPIEFAIKVIDFTHRIGYETLAIRYILNRHNELISMDYSPLENSPSDFLEKMLGSQWDNKFLNLSKQELINLLPSAIAFDLEKIASEEDFRGFALLLDNIDQSSFLFPEYFFDIVMQSRRILILSTSTRAIELENHKVENKSLRCFTKNDFYRFLRLKGLSITPAQDTPNFRNSTILIPFWANIFAEILKMGIFPKDNLNLNEDELAKLFLESIESTEIIQKIQFSHELSEIPENIEPILDAYNEKPMFAQSIILYIRELFPEENQTTQNQINEIAYSLFTAEIGYFDNSHANNIPNTSNSLFFLETLRRQRENLFLPAIRQKIAKNAIANDEDILKLVVDAVELIETYTQHKEFQSAKDILYSITSRIASYNRKNQKNSILAKCFLALKSAHLSVERMDFEAALSQFDTLTLYWARANKSLQDKELLDLFKLESLVFKAELLNNLHSESASKFINSTIKEFSYSKDVYSTFLLARLNLLNAEIFSNNPDKIFSFLQEYKKHLKTIQKLTSLPKGIKIILEMRQLLDFAQITVECEQYDLLEKTLFNLEALFQDIEIPDRYPQLMKLRGQTLMYSGFSHYYQEQFKQALFQLSQAAKILEPPTNSYEYSSLGKIYYSIAVSAEKTRNFSEALAAYSNAEEKARHLLAKGDDPKLFELLGSLLIKKGKCANILGKNDEKSHCLDEGIKIYRFLLKIDPDDNTIIINLAQALLFRATVSNYEIEKIITEIGNALELIENSHPPYPEKILVAIGSTALTIYNRTIEKNDYPNSFKATILVAKAAIISKNKTLLLNTKTLITQWQQFPLSENSIQILEEISQQL